MVRRILPLIAGMLACGCLYPHYHQVDETVCQLSRTPFDLAPPAQQEMLAPASIPAIEKSEKQDKSDRPDRNDKNDRSDKEDKTSEANQRTGQPEISKFLGEGTDLKTVAYLERSREDVEKAARESLIIPGRLPGSETKLVKLPEDETERTEYLKRLYPKLDPLPKEPTILPGPNGKPYSLDDFQRLAVENSPTLRQAASDIVAAEGNKLQARMYPNPTISTQAQPSNDGSTSGVKGIYVEQLVKTGGKLKLQEAAAHMDLENARLALKRARSDLATQVRNNYFAFLVSLETVRVTRSLAEFTDEVYRVQEKYLQGGQGAPYEPAALRWQAQSARLAYRQAIQTYLYNWEQLVASIGLRHLPLSQVSGRIDVCIPYYDYSAVQAHMLKNHTDVVTAYNGIEKARLNLKLAQVTVVPDIDVQFGVFKEFALPPFQWFNQVQVGVPIPIWDQNRGNIIAAQGTLIRAQEEPHRVELNLNNNLANAYTNYRTNLEAVEAYRRFILPDQVRVYRGVLSRRDIDPNAAFADLVGAQQSLATGVTQYLTSLGALWTSVVAVADFMQTDDLFQQATPRTVDPIPELEHLPALPCNHGCAPAANKSGVPHLGAMAGVVQGGPLPGLPGSSAPAGQQPSTLPEIPATTDKIRSPKLMEDQEKKKPEGKGKSLPSSEDGPTLPSGQLLPALSAGKQG